jgi:flagellar hook-associated protein 2
VNLASIGISVGDDGTLSVDSTTLNNALSNNFAAVQNLFQSTSPAGVAYQLNKDLTWLTDPISGPFNADLNSVNSEVSDLQSQITNFETQLQAEQQQLTTQYSNINTTLEQLPLTLAAINSQLNALNPPNNG